MGEGEVGVKDCNTHCLELGDGGDRDRVEEWEVGLPSLEDLTPLSQALISPELASAFSITPEPCRTMLDVSRASRTTIASLQRRNLSVSGVKVIPLFGEDERKGGGGGGRDPVVVEEQGRDEGNNKVSDEGSELRKVRRTENTEDIYSAIRMENSSNCNSNEDQSGARSNSSKRQRLVWTPQLHKRFVDAVAHLGIKNAVPKTIMQLMNVEGLTRENVASHLQKYRLYLKRMQGLSNEGPSTSDKLFSSTPVPQSLREPAAAGTTVSGHVPMPMPMPMPYAPPMMTYGHGGMVPQMVPYHGFDMNQYSMYREQQKDWNGHKFASYMSQQHVAPQK